MLQKYDSIRTKGSPDSGVAYGGMSGEFQAVNTEREP